MAERTATAPNNSKQTVGTRVVPLRVPRHVPQRVPHRVSYCWTPVQSRVPSFGWGKLLFLLFESIYI